MIRDFLELLGQCFLLIFVFLIYVVSNPNDSSNIINEKDNLLIDLLQSTPEDVSSATFFYAINSDASPIVVNEILNVNRDIVNHIDKLENTTLHNAILKANTNILLILIHKYPESVKIKNSLGEYPIHLAIKYHKDILVIKELLKVGRLPNLSYPTQENVDIPLDYTIERTKINNKTLFELIIENYKHL
tara:strand:+ start:610 stop:1176 length:567 start_codon:yes stop_codon:yes gene_type:complete